MTAIEFAEHLHIQTKLEKEMFEEASRAFLEERARDVRNNNFSNNKSAILVFKTSIDVVARQLDEFLNTSTKVTKYNHLQHFLKTYYKEDTNNLAYLLISIVLNIKFEAELKYPVVAKSIMRSVIQEIDIKSLAVIDNDIVEKYYKKFSARVRAKKKLALTKNNKKIPQLDDSELVSYGSILLDLLIKSGANIIEAYKSPRNNILMVGLTDDTLTLLMKTEAFFINNSMAKLPLVIPPKKWEGLDGSGGYYTKGNFHLIKIRSKKQQRLLQKHTTDISSLLDTINKLQDIPYMINKKILDVVSYITENNIRSPRCTENYPFLIGNIPYQDLLDTKAFIKQEDYNFGSDDTLDPYKYALYKRAYDIQERRVMKSKSKAIQYRLALVTAKKYSKYKAIYFSYQLDFRGRLYPIQQHLNPQAPEEIKPLLMFSEGQVLDADGFYWLKVQGANVYGYDKLSFEDRVSKIEDMTDEIIEIANDPLGTMYMWDKADEPLQFLTFCLSYKDALEGKPVHIPVYLDGSCSGIQNYSGLLLDKVGAIATNVIPNGTDIPSDIYREVAEEGKRIIEEGAYPREYTTKDGKVHNTHRAFMEVYNNINRSMTKKNVMTQPYSVTLRGMLRQNDDTLEEAIDSNTKWWTAADWLIARCLTDLNNLAIARVVKGAKIGQTFLKETLRDHLKDKDYVVWYTPFFNLPVIQRIKKDKAIRVSTAYGTLGLVQEGEDTHTVKMMNGVAPNYIHSMDSTLLFLTVMMCQALGITNFMLIHDSFGVRPNDVKVFNEQVREAFIALYKDKPLGKWYKDITGQDMDESIYINDLDLNEVRNSKYIFS